MDGSGDGGSNGRGRGRGGPVRSGGGDGPGQGNEGGGGERGRGSWRGGQGRRQGRTWGGGYGRGSGQRGRGGGRGGYSGGRRPRFLDEGMCGFLATCNFNERDCQKEAMNLLYEYGADAPFMPNVLLDRPVKPKDVTGAEVAASTTLEGDEPSTKAPNEIGKDVASQEVDVDKELEAEIAELKQEKKAAKYYTYGSGVHNVVFIYSRVDVSGLAHKILSDVHETQTQKSKFLLRLIPVELTCRANMEQLECSAPVVFHRYLKTGFNSFQILFNSRYNSSISRTEVIKLLADQIGKMNPLNVVDLTNPTFTILVEVVKNVICLAVVRDYNKFKKYNLLAAAGVDCSNPEKSGPEEGKQADEVPTATKTGEEDSSKLDSEKMDEVDLESEAMDVEHDGGDS